MADETLSKSNSNKKRRMRSFRVKDKVEVLQWLHDNLDRKSADAIQEFNELNITYDNVCDWKRIGLSAMRAKMAKHGSTLK